MSLTGKLGECSAQLCDLKAGNYVGLQASSVKCSIKLLRVNHYLTEINDENLTGQAVKSATVTRFWYVQYYEFYYE